MMGGMSPAPEVRLLPAEPGVYRFRTAHGRILYIGRATSLRQRVAILERRPDAVAAARSVLEQRRDRAAGKLAFELAARIQEEIDALAWVTAVQRVTRADRLDLEVCGRAAGIQVRFTVRGGRLSEWTVRPGAGTGGAGPAEWRDFADANAALAARLLAAPTG